MAIEALGSFASLAASLPWAASSQDAVRRLMGEDYWPYGALRNRAAIESIAGYSHAQGLASRKLALEDLFAPSSLKWNP